MKQNADGAWANDVCGSSQGVCCIHEVVWGMSNDITSSHERDQVGIHEAMEAGVMATGTSRSLKGEDTWGYLAATFEHAW